MWDVSCASTLCLTHSMEFSVCCRGIGVTIVCPGPVAPPVGEASPRSLYGPKGPIQRQEVPDSKRMPASRAALLIANAMAAGVSECWLARQPVLLMGEWCETLGRVLHAEGVVWQAGGAAAVGLGRVRGAL